MLKYSLSRREKALLLGLAIILLFLAWFMLVFQRTNEQIITLDGEMAVVDSQVATTKAQVNRMHAMQATIDKQKAAGVSPTPVPTFDNMTALMAELNGILGITTTYSLAFDDLDTATSTEYVLRGVTIDYGCDSFIAAENVVRALAKGKYPCSIDSVQITDSSVNLLSRVPTGEIAGDMKAKVHVTFFEKYPKGSAPKISSSTSASAASASVASASATGVSVISAASASKTS